jgi:hypothetical protein
MTTMNNEDPADPSVHEPRVLDAGVGRLEPERVELMRQLTSAQREVRSWPEWMTARATMPKWMMEWDD